MLAINHAATGAAIGLTISNPLLAVPLAIVSHFVLDAIPHYDPPGDETTRIRAKRFIWQLVIDTSFCVLLVCILALAKPKDWFLACVCAFLAASPDLLWIQKFIRLKQASQYKTKSLFLQFHKKIQWRTSPRLWPIEAIYFVLLLGTIFALLQA